MNSAVQARRSTGSAFTEAAQRTRLIINVRLPGYEGLKRIWISPNNQIQSIEAMDQSCDRLPPEDLEVLDFEQDWISQGGVDLQINGAQGLAFPDLCEDNAQQLPEICEFLWQQGVDAFLPTLVTCDIEQLHRALGVLKHYCDRPSEPNAARILGVHLEGPCLNPAKRGAHPQEHLQPLTLEAMQNILGEYGSIVKMVTLAPELDPTGEVVEYLVRQGIAVSLGHSMATAKEANAAFDQGATLVTHAFNAMPSLHHREPGLLGAALVRSDVRCGFIADGKHISPLMLQLLLAMAPNNLFLVSDALSPLGLPDGTYPWDSREISVTHGTARLADGTLSGTTLPLLAGASNLVKWGLASVETAIALATSAPRLAMGYESGCDGSHSGRDGSRSGRDGSNHSDAPAHSLLSPYIGRSINQFLRWHLDEQGESPALSWKRL